MKKLLPIDLISLAFILLSIVYIAIGRERIPEAEKHIGILFLIIIAIISVIALYKPNAEIGGIRKIYTKILAFFRHWYPFLCLAYFFELSTIINHVIFKDFIDPFFQSIDQFIFGYQPSIEWGTRFSNIIVQEIFYFSYFSYYLVIPGVAFLIYYLKRENFEKYVFIVSFLFYICYITYWILPVVGGRYIPELFELTQSYQGGVFRHIMAYIYSNSGHSGSAFPSSHVAVTVIVNLGAYFFLSKKFGYYLLPLTVLLTIATVYCHYHYFIDTIFGVFYGLLLFKPAAILYHKLQAIIATNMINNKEKISVGVDY